MRGAARLGVQITHYGTGAARLCEQRPSAGKAARRSLSLTFAITYSSGMPGRV